MADQRFSLERSVEHFNQSVENIDRITPQERAEIEDRVAHELRELGILVTEKDGRWLAIDENGRIPVVEKYRRILEIACNDAS